ncbi:hypothetical protein FK531_20225 [Rhodococcus spelaei]|uniref:Uncharacterized protein n=1 Tax=Rhodococcus spelaei TaxID=2546320 RepID=A0A541B0C5_9NOCA|nr:hypothetical protein [Rhodococcus spelaei]TQF65762.1 hypothetical protein FK531_20225 [Rhodococcus spelaei]
MNDLSNGVDDMVRAILAYELEDLDTVDAMAVDDIRAGLLDDWVRAIASSGMLSERIVTEVERAWRFDPELLVDALLDGADEVTLRRFKGSRGRHADSLSAAASAFA